MKEFIKSLDSDFDKVEILNDNTILGDSENPKVKDIKKIDAFDLIFDERLEYEDIDQIRS